MISDLAKIEREKECPMCEDTRCRRDRECRLCGGRGYTTSNFTPHIHPCTNCKGAKINTVYREVHGIPQDHPILERNQRETRMEIEDRIEELREEKSMEISEGSVVEMKKSSELFPQEFGGEEKKEKESGRNWKVFFLLTLGLLILTMIFGL